MRPCHSTLLFRGEGVFAPTLRLHASLFFVSFTVFIHKGLRGLILFFRRISEMKLISTRFDIPASHPFDSELWFENFIGHFILPYWIQDTFKDIGLVAYSENGIKYAQFRFYIQDYSLIEQKITDLMKAPLYLKGGIDNQTYDAGEISGHPRFLGTNQRQQNKEQRKDLIWDFLHATAVLYVDNLSHIDASGYWQLEENQEEVNCSTKNTFEAIHHMFCNVSGFDPRVFAPGQANLPFLIGAMPYLDHHIKQLKAQGVQPPYSIPAPQADQRVRF